MPRKHGPILIVEDDLTDQLLLEEVIRHAQPGRVVRTVSGGEQCLEYLEGRGACADRAAYPIPTMVLLDLKLPGMPGLEVLNRIREQRRFAGLVVVVMTGSNQTMDIHWAFAMGADLYLVKPPTVETLKKVLTAGDRARVQILKQSLAGHAPSHGSRPNAA